MVPAGKNRAHKAVISVVLMHVVSHSTRSRTREPRRDVCGEKIDGFVTRFFSLFETFRPFRLASAANTTPLRSTTTTTENRAPRTTAKRWSASPSVFPKTRRRNARNTLEIRSRTSARVQSLASDRWRRSSSVSVRRPRMSMLGMNSRRALGPVGNSASVCCCCCCCCWAVSGRSATASSRRASNALTSCATVNLEDRTRYTTPIVVQVLAV